MSKVDTEDRWLEGICWFLAAFSILAIVAGDIGGVIGVVGMTWLAVSLHKDRQR
jgi:hypothetical protein